MTDVVKHMKWWGWGREGVGFHHEDKPEFAPFVLNAVGLDLHTATPAVEPNFDELKVPRSKATAAFVKELAAIVGAEHVTKDDMMRVVHTYGKSLRDLVRNWREGRPEDGLMGEIEIAPQYRFALYCFPCVQCRFSYTHLNEGGERWCPRRR